MPVLVRGGRSRSACGRCTPRSAPPAGRGWPTWSGPAGGCRRPAARGTRTARPGAGTPGRCGAGRFGARPRRPVGGNRARRGDPVRMGGAGAGGVRSGGPGRPAAVDHRRSGPPGWHGNPHRESPSRGRAAGSQARPQPVADPRTGDPEPARSHLTREPSAPTTDLAAEPRTRHRSRRASRTAHCPPTARARPASSTVGY